MITDIHWRVRCKSAVKSFTRYDRISSEATAVKSVGKFPLNMCFLCFVICKFIL